MSMSRFDMPGSRHKSDDAGPTEPVKNVDIATRLARWSMPVAAKEWPIWAKGLKLLAKPEDKGIGDVVKRLIGDEKSEAFKAWHKKTLGKDCGCTGRQARWNRQFPLN